MNTKTWLILGGVAAGYFLATTLKTQPIISNAYNLGYNVGYGTGFSLAVPANG